jgi:tRNA modification GTPase
MPQPPDFRETIAALASAPGGGGRAIIRLSGPEALSIAGGFFVGSPTLSVEAASAHESNERRRWLTGEVTLPGIITALPVDLYVWPAPQSYTGQEVVELHTIASPPLVELLLARLLDRGARLARPGEFTMRAFLAGKLDLTRAEAVAGIMAAGSRDELRQALAQLAGGISRPLEGLRENLLDLLADVEAALDFGDEDIRFVQPEELLHRLAGALAQVTLLGKQLDRRGLAGPAFRVVLAGQPNAGKSTLFNALAGLEAALVSPQPGTTRDYLVRWLDLEGTTVELVDTAGLSAGGGVIEEQAQELAKQQAMAADLMLHCREAGKGVSAEEVSFLTQAEPPVVGVATKCDLADPEPGWHPTSGVTGVGLTSLRRLLAERARQRPRSALGSSLARCRHHVGACLDHLRAAHRLALEEDPPEFLAVELRGTLDQLGEMVGAVYSDDLLDRIFSRFCIGK